MLFFFLFLLFKALERVVSMSWIMFAAGCGNTFRKGGQCIHALSGKQSAFMYMTTIVPEKNISGILLKTLQKIERFLLSRNLLNYKKRQNALPF
ncbi:MAG: hypothetical protein ABWZ66_09585 [Pyrinomonadaceae bacterium]